MTSQFNLEIAQQRIDEMQERAAASRRAAASATPQPELANVVALRLAGADENDDLVRLAQLDSARPLTGEAVIALVDGRLVAAMSLADGRVIADPMTHTADARALLAQRVAQLNHTPRATRRRRLRLRLA